MNNPTGHLLTYIVLYLIVGISAAVALTREDIDKGATYSELVLLWITWVAAWPAALLYYGIRALLNSFRG